MVALGSQSMEGFLSQIPGVRFLMGERERKAIEGLIVSIHDLLESGLVHNGMTGRMNFYSKRFHNQKTSRPATPAQRAIRSEVDG